MSVTDVLSEKGRLNKKKIEDKKLEAVNESENIAELMIIYDRIQINRKYMNCYMPSCSKISTRL